MRILVVTQHFWPENFRINDIVEGFVQDGLSVDVLCGLPNYPKGEWFDGYSADGPVGEGYKGVPCAGDPPQGQHRQDDFSELRQLAALRGGGVKASARRVRCGILLQHQPRADVLACHPVCKKAPYTVYELRS